MSIFGRSGFAALSDLQTEEWKSLFNELETAQVAFLKRASLLFTNYPEEFIRILIVPHTRTLKVKVRSFELAALGVLRVVRNAEDFASALVSTLDIGTVQERQEIAITHSWDIIFGKALEQTISAP